MAKITFYGKKILVLCFINIILMRGIVMAEDEENTIPLLTQNDFEIIHNNIIKYEYLWKETPAVDFEFNRIVNFYRLANYPFGYTDDYMQIQIHNFLEEQLRYNTHYLDDVLRDYNIDETEKYFIYKLTASKSIRFIVTIVFYYNKGTFRFIDWKWISAKR
ncbi:hypothetical protein ACYULU_00990 [Breznakiellaceae bacterium SP9]